MFTIAGVVGVGSYILYKIFQTDDEEENKKHTYIPNQEKNTQKYNDNINQENYLQKYLEPNYQENNLPKYKEIRKIVKNQSFDSLSKNTKVIKKIKNNNYTKQNHEEISYSETYSKKSKYKVEPCFYFFIGKCNRERCRFSHISLYKIDIDVPRIETKLSVYKKLSNFNPIYIVFKSRHCIMVGFSKKEDLINTLKSTISGYRFKHQCYKCGCDMTFRDGIPYYKSSSTIGTKGDWDYIGKKAVNEIYCGACNKRSSSPHRSLYPGEIVFGI